MTDAIRALVAGRDLDADETEAAIDAILAGEASDASTSAFLTALKVKGETADELVGAVRAVRARVSAAGLIVPASGLLDTCGTGGDMANTVNVSTAAAIVVAACGVPVAKHGNRAASGNSGSAEVLDELGVAVDAEPAVLSRCLAELGIAFLFAPRFHPGLRSVAAVRRELPFRTLFNLVGPLANPARPGFQLLGVAGEAQARLVAGALARLGTTRAAVVTGHDGLDEVSLDGPTRVLLVERGEVSERRWLAADFGLGPAPVADLRVSGPADSAARISHLLAGEPGPVRETVLANAAAALWVAGEPDLEAAVARAADAIDSGLAARLLMSWREMSHQPVVDRGEPEA
jgi:anthranilate phosphoribosyltransferase